MSEKDWVVARIDAVAQQPWPAPPHGYPRLHEDRCGKRWLDAARAHIAGGPRPQQPDGWPFRFYAEPAGVIYPAEAVPIAAIVLLATFLTASLAGAVPAFVVFIALGGLGVLTVQQGWHRPLVRAVADNIGYRWEPGAVEYVPWVSSVRPGRLEKPAGLVGPDCAIVLVAEQIGGLLETFQDAAVAAGNWAGPAPVNVTRELEEIAWAVADYRAHRAQIEAVATASDADWIAAVTDEREAIIDRVRALYRRQNELGQYLADHSAASASLEPRPELPDLSGSFGAAYRHREAAQRIDGYPTDPSGTMITPERFDR